MLNFYIRKAFVMLMRYVVLFSLLGPEVRESDFEGQWDLII